MKFLDENIFLTGFSGAGKSAGGKALADMLNRPFIDMDAELEKRLCASIPEIFAKRGESFFRTSEARLLRELFGSAPPIVAAVGGGVVESASNRELLKGARAFFLNPGLEALRRRLTPAEVAKRPLLQEEGALEKLWARRLPLYAECGQAITQTGPPDALAKKIVGDLGWLARIRFSAGGRPCDYELAWGGAAKRIKNFLGARRGIFLLDHAFRAEQKAWAALLPACEIVLTLKRGEGAKTLAEAERVLKIMANQNLKRDDWLIARGGGALCDLGGFCAGLHKRGLNLALVPTTILAAADAAVGGKAAVNFEGAKNQLGLFYQPRRVIVDLASFKNLPAERLAEGLVEIYKTGLLFDAQLAAMIRGRLDIFMRGDLPYLASAVFAAGAAKARLAARDFTEERGLRDVLNLGHTYGHVLESYHAPRLSHGRAVAQGLAVMARLSERLVGLSADTADEIVDVARRLAGSWQMNPGAEAALELLGRDKKARAGERRFVLLSALERPIIHDVSPEDILKAAEAIR